MRSLSNLSAGAGCKGRFGLDKTSLGGCFSCLIAAFSAMRENVNLRFGIRSRGAGSIDVACIQTGLWQVLAHRAGSTNLSPVSGLIHEGCHTVPTAKSLSLCLPRYSAVALVVADLRGQRSLVSLVFS